MTGRVVVAGSSGLVGRRLCAFLTEAGFSVTAAARTSAEMAFDLRSPDSIDWSPHSGSTVVVAAAVSKPALCESDFIGCWEVNVEGTARLIQGAIGAGCRVLFLSSDAVYASESDLVYDEDSERAPQFAYGKMKAEVERRFEGDPLFKAVRLSYVCSKRDAFTSYLLSCASTGGAAEVFHPYYRNATTAQDVCTAIGWLVGNWEKYSYSSLNVAGPELVSRVRMADELRAMGLGPDYEISRPDESFYKCRPAVTRMTSKHLHGLGVVPDRPFHIAYSAELKGDYA